jgi:hypothetical protein
LSGDPNAALWASITPPPSPSWQSSIRRRLAGLAPDLLAQRLHLALPHWFPSRAAAGRTILATVMALGAGAGLGGFAVASSWLDAGADEASAATDAAPARLGSQPAPLIAERQGNGDTAAAQPGASAEARVGQTGFSDAPATLTATAAAAPEQAMHELQGSDELDEEPKRAISKAKKRAHGKKRVKARAKPRAKAASMDIEAAEPERTATPPRARPRRQPAFKFN